MQYAVAESEQATASSSRAPGLGRAHRRRAPTSDEKITAATGSSSRWGSRHRRARDCSAAADPRDRSPEREASASPHVAQARSPDRRAGQPPECAATARRCGLEAGRPANRARAFRPGARMRRCTESKWAGADPDGVGARRKRPLQCALQFVKRFRLSRPGGRRCRAVAIPCPHPKRGRKRKHEFRASENGPWSARAGGDGIGRQRSEPGARPTLKTGPGELDRHTRWRFCSGASRIYRQNRLIFALLWSGAPWPAVSKRHACLRYLMRTSLSPLRPSRLAERSFRR